MFQKLPLAPPCRPRLKGRCSNLPRKTNTRSQNRRPGQLSYFPIFKKIIREKTDFSLPRLCSCPVARSRTCRWGDGLEFVLSLLNSHKNYK